MKLPRDLSGIALAQHLCKRWAYLQVNQVGSHIILQTQQPRAHRIAIPAYNPLKVGTLNGIISDVAHHKNVAKEVILEKL